MPATVVYLNARRLEPHEARVSAFDAGLQHGVGLFETMLAVRASDAPRQAPAAVLLDEHLDRLESSARALGLARALRAEALRSDVQAALDDAGRAVPDQRRFRVRLTVTGGDLNLLAPAAAGGNAPGSAHEPTVLVHVQPATDYPEAMFERGVLATIADWKANPLDAFQGHKTLNYWPRLRELQAAAARRAGEALVFMVTNHLAGGCVSNAFLVKDGMLITPIARGEEDEVAALGVGGSVGDDDNAGATGAGVDDLSAGAPAISTGSGPVVRRFGADAGAVMPSPVLPGVTRGWVLGWAARTGVRVERRMVTISDVLEADELFLTNSSWGVLPVTQVEARVIGSGGGGGAGGASADARGGAGSGGADANGGPSAGAARDGAGRDGAVGPTTRALITAWRAMTDA